MTSLILWPVCSLLFTQTKLPLSLFSYSQNWTSSWNFSPRRGRARKSGQWHMGFGSCSLLNVPLSAATEQACFTPRSQEPLGIWDTGTCGWAGVWLLGTLEDWRSGHGPAAWWKPHCPWRSPWAYPRTECLKLQPLQRSGLPPFRCYFL